MANDKDLAWGLRDNVTAPAIWGARAILENGAVSLVHDRQDIKSDSASDRAALVEALCGSVLNVCLRKAKNLSSSDTSVHVVIMEGVVFRFSTRGSCGYLYISAHLAREAA